MMLEHELEEAMDLQRTRLSQRDQYVDLAKYHERHSEIAEALEAERIAGECLVEVLQLAQKVCEHWVERAKDAWAERDALAAELKAVKAGLPRWRLDQDGRWHIRIQLISVATIAPYADKWWSPMHPTLGPWDTREAAMLAVTEALGLPPCEVEGE